MRAKLITEKLSFERGKDPKKSMGIGKSVMDDKIEELKHSDWATENDFKEDRFILYLFEKTYKKWIEKSGSVTPENIEIWNDSTNGGSSIIKLKAPGVKTTTILRWEYYSDIIMKEVSKIMESPELKQKLAIELNQDHSDLEELGKLIFTAGKRMHFHWSGMYVARGIADRLIELMKNPQ